MPTYIVPISVKLFLPLYSGVGGGGEKQEGKFNQNMSTSILQLFGWHLEGPVFKLHLECKYPVSLLNLSCKENRALCTNQKEAEDPQG